MGARALRCFQLGLLMPSIAAGCADQPRGPYFDDHRHLVFGVDPDTEADRLVEQLTAGGRALRQRVRGKHFTALGFDDVGGNVGPVRVVTARGIALAFDPATGDALQHAVRYRLLEGPVEGTQDADGDGFEEVFVERLEAGNAEGCIEPFRVRNAGFVDPVPVQTELMGGEGCVEDVRDVDADGRAELWLVLRVGPLDAGAPLALGLPLSAERHAYVARPNEAPAVAALTARRGALELGLSEAQSAGDAEGAYRAALELELIGRLSGTAAKERRAALEAALGGSAVDPARVAEVLAALDAEIAAAAEAPKAAEAEGASGPATPAEVPTPGPAAAPAKGDSPKPRAPAPDPR